MSTSQAAPRQPASHAHAKGEATGGAKGVAALASAGDAAVAEATEATEATSEVAAGWGTATHLPRPEQMATRAACGLGGTPRRCDAPAACAFAAASTAAGASQADHSQCGPWKVAGHSQR